MVDDSSVHPVEAPVDPVREASGTSARRHARRGTRTVLALLVLLLVPALISVARHERPFSRTWVLELDRGHLNHRSMTGDFVR